MILALSSCSMLFAVVFCKFQLNLYTKKYTKGVERGADGANLLGPLNVGGLGTVRITIKSVTNVEETTCCKGLFYDVYLYV